MPRGERVNLMASGIPNFTAIEFATVAAPAAGAVSLAPCLTPEGIAVKPAYGPADLDGLDFLDTYPGIAPFLRGPYPTMYVTQPWTIR
jgi:methylmalonyl-CoA mutase